MAPFLRNLRQMQGVAVGGGYGEGKYVAEQVGGTWHA